MKTAELKNILKLHKAWLYGIFGGVRADLRGADLQDANLRGAKNISKYIGAVTSIVPEGDIIGWKKRRDNAIVKLLIPKKARRSNATGRKCRAEYAKVLEVIGAEKGIGLKTGLIYEKGKVVKCDNWDEDRWNECSGGIHFFITRQEAEDYLNV